jgi:hypothetical protein
MPQGALPLHGLLQLQQQRPPLSSHIHFFLKKSYFLRIEYQTNAADNHHEIFCQLVLPSNFGEV